MTLSQAGSPRSRSGIDSRVRFAVIHGEYSQPASGGGTSMMYGATVYQVAANGVTGKIAGDRPWSWIKIVMLIIMIIIVLIVFQSRR